MSKDTILVTTDLSKCSLHAVAPAIDMARRLGKSLTFLTVVEPYAPIAMGPDAGIGTALEAIETLQEEEVAHARSELEKLRGELDDDLETRQVVVVERHPAKAILHQLERLEPGLVIMATHGRTGLAHMLLGSTVERVLRHSKVPVLTIPTRE